MKKYIFDFTFLVDGGFLQGNPKAILENIQFDSRCVSKNSLFCALRGTHTDGHNFIDEAIDLGASVILCSDFCFGQYAFTEIQLKKIAVIKVPDSNIKKMLAKISAHFYNFPANKLKIIGVTGTDGKSTTCSFIYQILSYLGEKVGLLSTIEFRIGNKSIPNTLRQSTPESPQIFHALSKMVDAHCEYAVIETTSHGLSKDTARLYGMEFDVGVLTCIDQEHLEFHRTIENYAEAKSNLFGQIKAEGQGILRKEEPYYKKFAEKMKLHGGHILDYSLSEDAADVYIKDFKYDITHMEATFVCKKDRFYKQKELDIYTHFTGAYNIENIMSSVLAVHALGYKYEEVVKLLPKLRLPSGRLELVRNDLNILPIVDYAHTPGSFSTLFPFIKKLTPSRLIVMFGSAGERDTEKRILQGEIADKYADIIVLTDEDPRLEDAMSIIKEIANGCKKHTLDKNLFLIPDRIEAIKRCLELSEEGDIILFLGKGHEKSIVYADYTQEWNEAKEVNQLVVELLPFKKW